MARSVFYYHLKRLKAGDKYAVEKECIKSVFHEHKGRYGYRRVTAEMHNRGFGINHKTVQRLMGELCLKSRIRKVRYRSYKGEVGKIAPNIIARDFSADAPNRKWATDVTQINIGSVKLYLSPILDMFNGEIISYNISKSPNLEQVYDMLDKAFAKFGNLGRTRCGDMAAALRRGSGDFGGRIGGHLDFNVVFVILGVFATREGRCQHEGKQADSLCSVHCFFVCDLDRLIINSYPTCVFEL